MPLGGIGTGNVEIGCDGQFTTWQLFNTLRDGQVPLWFVVKAGGVSRLLQTDGGPNWPRVNRIEMTGEYPIATLRYVDAELPVKLELSAFTPFAPLDAKFSSQPLAALVFRVQNPTAESADRLVGRDVAERGGLRRLWPGGAEVRRQRQRAVQRRPGDGVVDAGGAGQGGRHRPARDDLRRREAAKPSETSAGTAQGLRVALMPGNSIEAHQGEPSGRNRDFAGGNSGERFRGVVGARLAAWSARAPRWSSPAGRCPLWKPTPATAPPSLPAVRTCGATWFSRISRTAISSGRSRARAFGSEPAAGTLPGQQPVTGFQGKRLANSFVGGDDATGRLIGRPFTIERNYIHFLIGGGAYPTTQLRLLVGGKVVRAASGENDEHLTAQIWDVRELAGKQAHLEIVDEQKGPWGHVSVDQIVFSDEIVCRKRASGWPNSCPPASARSPPRRASSRASPTRCSSRTCNCTPTPNKSRSAAGSTSSSGRWARARWRWPRAPSSLPSGWSRPTRGIEPTSRCASWSGPSTPLRKAFPRRPAASARWPWPRWARASPAARLRRLERRLGAVSAAREVYARGEVKPNPPTRAGHTVHGAVGVEVEVPAGGSVEIPFLFAWRYANSYQPADYAASDQSPRRWLGCYYATLWEDARAVIRQAAAGWPEVRRRTEAFRKTFYDSTLPYWMLDCMTSQAATIRHIGVVFRLADGNVYGWEGSNGCCGPTCTHVWGYEQSLAHLFPELEKLMRRIDFKHQQRAHGGVNNRTAFLRRRNRRANSLSATATPVACSRRTARR